MYEVRDKIFFVTGAANGIGAGTVRHLLAEGAKHVAILDVATELGVNLQNELNAKYGENKAKFYQCDVTNEEQLYKVYDDVKKDQGYIDTVINNAGILNDGIPAYKKAIAINVQALISSTYKALEIMRKDDGGNGGTIINVSSIAALHSEPAFPVYFATKSAVLQFDLCLSNEFYYKKTNVRILTICFGVTDTALYGTMNCFDKRFESELVVGLQKYPNQKMDTAAKAMIEAYKVGENGSVWLSTSEKPIKDITSTVKQAYGLFTELVFDQ